MKPKKRKTFNLAPTAQPPAPTRMGGRPWWWAALLCAIIGFFGTRSISTIHTIQKNIVWQEEQAGIKVGAGEAAIRSASPSSSLPYHINRQQAEVAVIEAEIYLKNKASAEKELASYPPLSIAWALLILALLAFVFCLFKASTSPNKCTPANG